MKNYILVIIYIHLTTLTLYGQATSGGLASAPNRPNTPGVDYLGWDNTVTVPLMIRTNNTGANAQSINFFTNATERMSLSASGNLGISDVWPFNPLSLIHLNRGLNVAVSTRYTNINSTNGALFGIDANGNARINQQDPLAINFLTNGTQR